MEIKQLDMNQRLEKIYNKAFDLIELRLKQKEQVAPFIVYIEDSEEKPIVAMYEQSTEETADYVQEMRRLIKVKINEGTAIASCLCYDVKITDPRTNEIVDAITCELDSPDESIDIHVPYNFDLKNIIQTPFQQSSTRCHFS